MKSVQRRDDKGRPLHTGETQIASGRYVYRYTNRLGKRKAVYSWRLNPSDAIPSGTKRELSLREKEKHIAITDLKGVFPQDFSVQDIVIRYVATKTGVKYSTRKNYQYIIDYLGNEEFGHKKIDTIKTTDAKLFLIDLQRHGKRYSTVSKFKGLLCLAFQMAVDDEMLLHNPFDFSLATIIVNDTVPRVAISNYDEKRYLEFLRNDRTYSKYYDGIYILFKTGLRISEFCGLTLDDIDLENKVIDINHQIFRTEDLEYVVSSTKSSAGTRRLPISDEVVQTFEKIIAQRKQPKNEFEIQGYKGFLFLDKFGKPKLAHHWQSAIRRSVNKYNSKSRVMLPKISAHVCRHTYCTNMAKAGMSPKTLQYMMGHSEIEITLNTYTHVAEEDARREVEKICNAKKQNKRLVC